MKTAKYMLMMLFMACMALTAQAQTKNELVVADHPFWASYIDLPVLLENTDEVVAVQADLLVPSFLSVSEWNSKLSEERTTDHAFTLQRIASRNGIDSYRLLIYSPTNAPLKGTSGAVINVRLSRPDKVEVVYGEVTATNVILSSKDSRNVVTGVQGGVLDFTDLPTLQVKASKSTLTDAAEVPRQCRGAAHHHPERGQQPLRLSLAGADSRRAD